MKWCSVVAWLLLGFVLTDVEAQGQLDIQDFLKDFLSSSCTYLVQNVNANAQFVEHVQNLLGSLQTSSKTLQTDQKRFCQSDIADLKRKVGLITEDIYPCFEEDEKYFSKFLNDSFAGTVDFLCAHNGENIQDLTSKDAFECGNNLQSGDVKSELKSCFSDVKKFIMDVQKKEDLCANLDSSKQCLAKSLEQHCPSFGPSLRLNREFFEGVSRPCSAACAFSTGTLMVAAAALVAKYFS